MAAAFVFGFVYSLPLAVQAQARAPCRELLPAHARVTGRVVDTAGRPLPNATIAVASAGHEGEPVSVDPERGGFHLFAPRGSQHLRVRVPGLPRAELALAVGRGVSIEVQITVADTGHATLAEQSRTVFSAPPFVVHDAEGREVRLDDFRGRPVVINFWATWCEPCKAEWVQLAKLAERLAGESVEVIAISIDANWADVARFLEDDTSDGARMRVLWDRSTTLHRRFGSERVPDTYLIDEHGVVIGIFTGPRQWGSPGARTCVERSVL